jgi:hypothetical protein
VLNNFESVQILGVPQDSLGEATKAPMIQPEFGQLSFQESDEQVVRKFNALYGSNTRPRAILNGENVYFSSLERADGVQEPNGLKIGDAFWDK